jgi:hypothetical protein
MFRFTTVVSLSLLLVQPVVVVASLPTALTVSISVSSIGSIFTLSFALRYCLYTWNESINHLTFCYFLFYVSRAQQPCRRSLPTTNFKKLPLVCLRMENPFRCQSIIPTGRISAAMMDQASRQMWASQNDHLVRMEVCRPGQPVFSW